MSETAGIKSNLEPADGPQGPAEIDLRIATDKTAWLDRFGDRASEWLSPIVVKELRQTLKSYQFVWTFFLLLAAVLLWTLIGWTANQPVDYYTEVGPALLIGYFWILGFPLGIVIPFAAYRSLAREFDDGTIQLISISTMRSWQIVLGKLVSSAVQILIYLAILAPCISFTYLLRGISVAQITSGLAVCTVGSFLLASLGLFLAAVARSRFFSIGISILLVIGLTAVYFIWCGSAVGISYWPSFSGNDLAWQILLFGWSGMAVTTSLLLLAATSSLISFASDNGATLPRAMMLVQQTIFLAWCICMMTLTFDVDVLIGVVFILSHYWLIMGFAMVGESAQLSERVMRSLPRSVGMRSLFSLLFPGPGRGLIYSITNLWVSGAILLLIASWSQQLLPVAEPSMGSFSPGTNVLGLNDINRATQGTFVAFLYITLFLSLMYLFMRWVAIKTRWNWGPLASVMFGLTAVALLTTISTVLHYIGRPVRLYDDFSIYAAGNWYWATLETAGLSGNWTGTRGVPLTLLAFFACPPIAFALLLASRELLTRPQSLPQRITLDDQQIAEAKKPPVGETIDDIFNEPRPGDTT
ncbi:MAG: ABC transporter permease [Mariniblastus sp.]|nr:ABC transporter permease [Mariniblastus sp.]